MSYELYTISVFFQIAAYRSFDTKLEFINDDEVQSSAAQIQREIEEINNSLWKKEQNEILTDADETDPLGKCIFFTPQKKRYLCST